MNLIEDRYGSKRPKGGLVIGACPAVDFGRRCRRLSASSVNPSLDRVPSYALAIAFDQCTAFAAGPAHKLHSVSNGSVSQQVAAAWRVTKTSTAPIRRRAVGRAWRKAGAVGDGCSFVIKSTGICSSVRPRTRIPPPIWSTTTKDCRHGCGTP
jgi:hypothetical protein